MERNVANHISSEQKTNSHISTLEIKAYHSNANAVTDTHVVVFVDTFIEVGIILTHCVFYSQLTIPIVVTQSFFFVFDNR